MLPCGLYVRWFIGRVVNSEWVITSYLAANAFILPISGFLSCHLGRRNYFLMSIAILPSVSGLSGMSSSLGELISSG